MLKALAQHKDGRRVIVIGLSQENLFRLLLGEPIYDELTDLEIETPLMIFSGETEETMLAQISGAFKNLGMPVHADEEPPDWAKGAKGS